MRHDLHFSFPVPPVARMPSRSVSLVREEINTGDITSDRISELYVQAVQLLQAPKIHKLHVCIAITCVHLVSYIVHACMHVWCEWVARTCVCVVCVCVCVRACVCMCVCTSVYDVHCIMTRSYSVVGTVEQ